MKSYKISKLKFFQIQIMVILIFFLKNQLGKT
jgi:hypothetical protein